MLKFPALPTWRASIPLRIAGQSSAASAPTLPANVITHQHSVQRLHQGCRLDRHLLNVRAVQPLPNFSRCQAIQALMRPNVVVKITRLIQCGLQGKLARNYQRTQPGLGCSKKPLNSSVAPRCSQWNGLLSDTHQLEKCAKHEAVHRGLVVGAQRLGLVVLTDRQTQMPEQGPTAFVQQDSQAGADARAMVDDANTGVSCTFCICHKRHIHCPCGVDGSRQRFPVTDFSRNAPQQVLMVFDGLGDEGFADRSRRTQPIEGGSHFATTGMPAHQGLEAQHFAQNPIGFFAMVRMVGWGKRHNGSARVMRRLSARSPTENQEPEQANENQNRHENHGDRNEINREMWHAEQVQPGRPLASPRKWFDGNSCGWFFTQIDLI